MEGIKRMKSENYYQKCIDRVESTEQDAVFVASDFYDITEPGNVSVYLRRIVNSGRLRRISRGMYVKPENNSPSADIIARAIARNYSWNIVPCGDTALYESGITKKKPKIWTYVSEGMYKTYNISGVEIKFYHTDKQNEIANVSELTALYIQVLRAYGKRKLSKNIITTLAENVYMKEKRRMIYETPRITAWVRKGLIRIAEATNLMTLQRPLEEWELFPDGRNIATQFGYNVRSQSELLILMHLHMAGLEFKYEAPKIDKYNLPYWPDLTVKYKGKEYLWEHFGRLNDAKYAEDAKLKIKWYEANFPGRLITTNNLSDIGAQINKVMLEKFSFSLRRQGG